MSYQIEVTDTFGGEANYCWVNRKTVDLPAHVFSDDRAETWKRERSYLVREAKSFAGWTGLRAETQDFGDMIEIRPRGLCQVCFVTWID